MLRTIQTTLQAGPVVDDGDMLLLRALPAAQRTALGPFVFIDHYRHRSRRGSGTHPILTQGSRSSAICSKAASSTATAWGSPTV